MWKCVCVCVWEGTSCGALMTCDWGETREEQREAATAAAGAALELKPCVQSVCLSHWSVTVSLESHSVTFDMWKERGTAVSPPQLDISASSSRPLESRTSGENHAVLHLSAHPPRPTCVVHLDTWVPNLDRRTDCNCNLPRPCRFRRQETGGGKSSWRSDQCLPLCTVFLGLQTWVHVFNQLTSSAERRTHLHLPTGANTSQSRTTMIWVTLWPQHLLGFQDLLQKMKYRKNQET